MKFNEMNTALVKEKVDYFKKRGTMFWSFNGGEPLLRDDLGELSRYVKPMRVSLMTNGTFPERLKYTYFDRVFVSIDGPKSIQDGIRGEGTFKKNIKTLDILQRMMIPTVIVSVISEMNRPHLMEVLKIVKEYNALWDIQPVMNHHMRDNSDLIPVSNYIMLLKENKKHIFNSMDYLNYLENPTPLKCYAGKWYCTLAPDGKTYPCVEFMGNDAMEGMRDMRHCKLCGFNCYAEYNLMLNKPWKLYRAFKWR